MYCTTWSCWLVLFPAYSLLVAALVSPGLHPHSPPPRLSTYPGNFQTSGETPVQRLHVDQSSAQTSFIVPCFDCIRTGAGPNLAQDQSFLFHLEAFPSDQPCGTSNLELNGLPLIQEWDSTGNHGQGLANLTASGHDLNLVLRSDCLHDLDQSQSLEASTQLLTVSIEAIDRQYTRSLSGFTLSFKQFPLPQLLRLSLEPDHSARDLPGIHLWRDPPLALQLSSQSAPHFPTSAGTANDRDANQTRVLSLGQQLIELQLLEQQAKALSISIQQKKDLIRAQLSASGNVFKEETTDRSFLLYALKSISNNLHAAAHVALANLHRSRKASTNWHACKSGRVPTMTTSTDVRVPEQCHNHDGWPGPPPAYRGDVIIFNEKTSTNNATDPGNAGTSGWKSAYSSILSVLKFLSVITGLAFIFNCLKRCFTSDRDRAEQAAERERGPTERPYKFAVQKQSWRDWWYGRKRGKPGYRPGDFDEKRASVIQQERVLEGAMQVEIQQLRIQEEIVQLRRTRDAVDDIVRAEEGRHTSPRYAAALSQHLSGFQSRPAPISVPPPTFGRYSSYHNEFYRSEFYQHDINQAGSYPGTPLSRTSSLPEYRTDAGSEPPGYESDRRSSFSDHDDDSDYDLAEYAQSMYTTDSAWSPDSSLPDVEPRPSIETILTVETARNFL